MRLSEAIKLGAMLRPQRFGPPSGRVPLALEPASCALAAATEAVGNESLNISRDSERWPILVRLTACPACRQRAPHDRLISDGAPWPLSIIIVELNDQHRWTRERIAAWVATLEPADDRRASPEAADASDPHADSNTGTLATRA
jgi:hypothetical protein